MKPESASSTRIGSVSGAPEGRPRIQPTAGAWFWFAGAILASVFLHELGHCAVAWLHGYPAVPTPAKEYVLKTLPEVVQNQLALGGIVGSVLALLIAEACVYYRPTQTSSALLAGAMTAPGFYTLRFILAGRGHDATEFQEAQAALGLSYSGHAVDWLFVCLFVLATAFWFLHVGARLTMRLVGRLILGAVAALVFLALLQSVNNAVFDRLFQPKPKQAHPLGSQGERIGCADHHRCFAFAVPDHFTRHQALVTVWPYSS